MFNYLSPDMPINEFTVDTFNQYVLYLKGHLSNDMSINEYLRDLITTLHYLMDNEYMHTLKSIKIDKPAKEAYSNDELKILLKNKYKQM